LERVRDMLRRLVEGGVERASRGLVEELREVARIAHQGRLARIERVLVALSTQVERWNERDPQFRLGAWVDAINRLWWSVAAASRVLDDPQAGEARQAEVLGVSRRKYTPVDGTLTVAALGASGWVSDSGYAGITVHLWDVAGRRALTATQARPSSLVDGDPRRLLFHPVSEVSLLTVHELAHGAWELDDVRLSADGRLSLHAGLVAVPRPPLGPAAYGAFAVQGAAALIDRLAEAELDPTAASVGVLAWVPLSAVRGVVVDETSAQAAAELVDRGGVPIRVVVPVRPERDLLLDNLARLARGPVPVGVFGRATLSGGELRLDPYTAVFDEPVRLAFRRPGQVQEVHLGLEPLSGDAPIGRGRVRSAPAAPHELGEAVEATRRALEPLLASGIGWPAPEVAASLRSAAEGWGAVGASEASRRLLALADAVDAIRVGGPQGAASALDGAHGALQWLIAWVRLARAGVATDAARRRLVGASGAPAPRARGHDLVVVPLGATRAGTRLTVHALDARDGAPVVLQDELPGLDEDPFARTWPSRLFQGDVSLEALLTHRIVLRDHPVSRARGARVVRPAFETAATLGSSLGGASVVPKTPDAVAGPVFRTDAAAERGPEGWVLRVGANRRPVPVTDPLLQLDLEQRSALDALSFELLGVLRRDGGEVLVLQLDGRFPTLDPRATRWPRALLEARARVGDGVAGWIEAAFSGPMPTLPGDDPIGEAVRGLEAADAARFVASRVGALRRAMGEGGVLPPAAELLRLGRAAGGPADAPILALPVPRWRLWLSAASGLAAWLRGVPGAEAGALDALVLVAGAGLGDVLLTDP
jgi:hypothetical protein